MKVMISIGAFSFTRRSVDVLRKISGNKAETIKDGTWMASIRKVIEALGPDGEISEDVASRLNAIGVGAGMVR